MKPKPNAFLLAAAALCLTVSLTGFQTKTQAKGKARLILVIVLDGLRPDTISREDTPNIYNLREEGVHFTDSHAVFPTATRINAAAIATGTYPGVNGIMSNSMYVREYDPTSSFSVGEYQNLLRLEEKSGRIMFVKSISEILNDHGISFASVGSSSHASAFLSAPRARNGVGLLVHGYLEPGELVAFPEAANKEILARFGPAPAKDLVDNAGVDWTATVLRKYVLPTHKPAVVYLWPDEPDHAQHSYGIGSPEARSALRNDDRNIGLILAELRELNLLHLTDIIVMSDHGFSLTTYGINVNRELIQAGLKSGAKSDDVVTASSGQSVLIHVKDRDPARVRQIVEFLQTRDWAGPLFTSRAGNRPNPASGADFTPSGWVEGTFSLDLIRMQHPDRGPDVVLTFPWSSDKNSFGFPGTDYEETDGSSGPKTGSGSGHGSLSPWCIHNTMIAWGVDFKARSTVSVPVGNVDVVPTILALRGIDYRERLDGRVLSEALKGGPDEEMVARASDVYTTQARNGGYRIVIQISRVGQHWYVDKSWRTR